MGQESALGIGMVPIVDGVALLPLKAQVYSFRRGVRASVTFSIDYG